MKFFENASGRESDICKLFGNVFAEAEGAEEGKLIGQLSRDLLRETASGDLHTFYAIDKENVVAAIMFSRMVFNQDDRDVFVLGPVAVATARQGEGIGQSLISFGLKTLAQAGVEVALTYGDPKFYSRVGFKPITEEDVAAPFKLQYPFGWLGQSLTATPLTSIKGSSRCVTAMGKPIYW
ncbi:N-acetyltransferase [Roseibium porphyridii]|uniref:N-acetyltransferase n=1 Tax=Roseibium porphyridii TaxID=2866279 RepID=A0ABY8F433_9HYPH|nr:N-acetyltransferase [Roseibium sp. KMA01]WFE87498.1 N-acetyltransferase [Roseibium sp. KMA01]